MTTHLLTESDCDKLRTALLDSAIPGSPAFNGIHIAIKLLDQHRSNSFCRRAAAKAGLSKVLPIPGSARPALGLRYTR